MAADVWEQPFEVVRDAAARSESGHDVDHALFERAGGDARGGGVARRRVGVSSVGAEVEAPGLGEGHRHRAHPWV
jgi:hypothetical protein